MILHFSYDGKKGENLEKIKELLVKKGFSIKEYAPQEGLLFTDYKYFEWGTGERLLALVVVLDDKITITGLGKMAIPVANIGDSKSVLKIKKLDKLPYRVQKKIFFPLIKSMDSLGYKKMDIWP